MYTYQQIDDFKLQKCSINLLVGLHICLLQMSSMSVKEVVKGVLYNEQLEEKFKEQIKRHFKVYFNET